MFKISGVFPYLFAMFLNAFTDLGHKIVIQNTIFKVYDNQEQIILIAIVNALILLPYILLFTPSGYLATKFSKDTIMRYSAIFAIFITLFITYSYYHGYFEMAFILTFILGLQSAIYSPAKYGYIKELVGNKYISSGNAAVQSITTFAILGGIIFYSVLFQNYVGDDYESKEQILKTIAPLGWILVGGSVLEYVSTLFMPRKYAASKSSKFNFQRYRSGFYLKKNIHTMKRKKDIYIAILALSTFWAISQVVLASFGAYAKDTLGINNVIIVQGVMALAAIGIVLGSVVAARISKMYIHIGLSVIGSIGLTIMLLLLPFIKSIEIIAIIFTFFGFFAGLFIVAFNAYIQKNSSNIHLPTILAGNNFMQNIFMFSFLFLTTLGAFVGLDSVNFFYLMLAVALVMSIYLFKRYELSFYWVVVEIFLKLRYKFIFKGVENIPHSGAVLLLSNHISWIDWAILQFAPQRRIRYIMDRTIYNIKGVNYILRLGNAIPISNSAAKDAIKIARKSLSEHNMIVIFPEGEISHDGDYGKFSKGYELIAKGLDGVIICANISGLNGSFFSRSKKHFTPKSSFFRREVTITFSKPMNMNTKVEEVESSIKNLK